MEIHIIIRPKSRVGPDQILGAGTIQFSNWIGNHLQPRATATLWWKRKYIHARAAETISVVELEIPGNPFSRLLHLGFDIDIIQRSEPLFHAEFRHDETLCRGFTIQINLEKILSPTITRINPPEIVILKQKARLYPSIQNRYWSKNE